MAETNHNGVSRFATWVTIGVGGLSICGMIGAIFYFAFQTSVNTTTIKFLNDVINRNAESIRQLELRVSNQEVALNEVETQFHAQDIIRNLMHANEMRINSLLWQKVFPGTTIPTDNAYYPNISNRRASRPTRP